MNIQYLKSKYRVFRRSLIVRKCLQSVLKITKPMYMRFFWWPASYCIRNILPPPNKKDWEKRILIIKDDGIGDIVMSSGIIKYVKKSFPDKQIYVLVNIGSESLLKNCAEYILSYNPDDYFWKMPARWHLLKKLRKIGFSIVICGVHRRSVNDNDILISLDAQETIAYEGEGFELDSLRTLNKKYQNKVTKFIFSMDRETGIGNAMAKATDHDKYFYSKALNITIDDISPSIFTESHRSESLRHATLSMWKLTKHTYFTIGVGARAVGRIWPCQRYKHIAKWIFKTTGLLPVLIGGKGEENLGFELSNDNAQVINLIGKLTLNDSLTVLGNAAFFIGNESGPMHLSAAFRVPIVALFGGGHFGRCFPYGDHNEIVYYKMDCYLCNWKCKYVNLTLDVAPCIDNITIDLVESKLIDFFQKYRGYFNSINVRLNV
jgi:ADP-heptose:LPS heptosyltransferase